MGKKGKNKNQTVNVENVPKIDSEITEKKEDKKEVVPKFEPKVEATIVEPAKNEEATAENDESVEGTLKSNKKRRNRKKKNTATEIEAKESTPEAPETETQPKKIEPPAPKVNNVPKVTANTEESPSNEAATDTMKKKRRRNKKKNAGNAANTDENADDIEETIESEKQIDAPVEKPQTEASENFQQNTLKKRNRNKNKNAQNSAQMDEIESNEPTVEKPEPEPVATTPKVEPKEPQRRGKKQKRFDLTSKKTILDEIQERQEREQKEARDHIRNEIAKREKLLETIDLVLDCHKSEAEIAKNQQESLKDVKKLTTETAKPQTKPSTSSKSQKKAKKQSPAEEELVNKIEQVLGMTKLEIQNAQTQKAYVGRLEAEVAKVKQSKDILLGEKSTTAVPPHIQKLASEMCDISKGEVPKSKEELVKEIESRDALMAEINRVLDTTKTEIDKVQKQQKIIQNLEVELNKMKEQEIVEKLMVLADEADQQQEAPPPPPPKQQSAATASLLDALMANVGKLKEIQAMKEKQKAELENEDNLATQDATKSTKTEQTPVDAKQDKKEQPEQNKKNQKDQKKQPQKKEEAKHAAAAEKKEACGKIENKSNETKKIEEKKEEVKKEASPKMDEKEAVESVEEKKVQPQEEKKPQKEKKPDNLKLQLDKKIDSQKPESEKKTESPKPQPDKKTESPKLQTDKKPESPKPQTDKKPDSPQPQQQKVEEPKENDKKSEAPKPVKQESPKEDKKKDNNKQNKAQNDPKQEQKPKQPESPPIAQKAEPTKPEEKKIESPKQIESQSKTHSESEPIKKIEEMESQKPDEKPVNTEPMNTKPVETKPAEVKPIVSSEPITPEPEKPAQKENNKKNDKGSPKNNNKNNKHNKKDNKSVPEVVTPPPIVPQKPSMAEMLKNAPDPPPDEIEKKPNEEVKSEPSAPLARPESAIIEIKPCEQIKESTVVVKEDVREEISKPAEEIIKSELNPAEIMSKPAKIEPKSAKNEPKSAKNEPKPAKTEPKPAKIEPKSAEIVSKPAKKEPKPDKTEPKPTKTEFKQVEVVSETKLNEIVSEAMPAEIEPKPEEPMVIVDKAQVEKEMKEVQKQGEMESTDPKNVQGSGFVSPVKTNNEQDKDAKPLVKDAKQQPSKTRSPVKAPSKPAPSKPAATKTPKQTPPKPKIDVQAKVNSKPDSKKTASPPKPSSPATEKPQSKFDSTESASITDNSAESSTASTEKPKIPPRPDVTKTSNTKPAVRAGNVTNQSPVKPKTPSPSKPPTTVTKPTSTVQTATAKQSKPTVSQATRPTAAPKTPTNTKTTNQKPPAPQQQKTKPQAKSSSTTTCDSVFRLRQQQQPQQQQLRRNNNIINNKNFHYNNKKTFSQPAFRIRMDEKSLSSKRPHTHPDNNTNTQKMKAILTKDGTIKIILPSTVTGYLLQETFLSKDVTTASNICSNKVDDNKQLVQVEESRKQQQIDDESDDDDDDDRYSEYKMTPRQIFCASICQICKVNLSRYFLCHECKMVAYCKEEHMKIDYLNHKGLCMAIQLIAKRRGGHVYNMAKHLTSMEFRNLRLHTIYLCEQFLNRTLLTFEREIFLFPRLCHEVSCREWKSNLLNDCEKCGLVSFCALHPLNENHKAICSSFALFQRIILHEKSYGRVNVSLPQKVLRKTPTLSDCVEDTMRLLYRNVTAFQDECVNAALMQIASSPLTAFYAYQKVGLQFKEQMTVHFVGAELKFEGDRLEKWESFFLHLAHDISDLELVFIGAELNHENLPVEIMSRKRMCNMCRQNCCGIRYDFQCKKFYHDYCESSAYVKPDFVCLFNPAIYRPGFRGFDTWPKSIETALKTGAPILVTSTTENECYLDLKRIKNITNDDFVILVPPIKNPFASTRPERNFASDEDDPIMFKNNYLFVISKTQDLIEF